MVKIIDGEKELLVIPREDVTFSCVVVAIVMTIVTLPLMGVYKIFFPTAVEANTEPGQIWGLIAVFAFVVLAIIISVVVGIVLKDEEMIIHREDVEGKKVVCVRSVSITYRMRNRSFSIYIPGYKRKSFKIPSYSMPEFRNALERLGASVELAGSWPGINPRGET